MTQTSTDSLTSAELARMERLPLAEDIPALLAALRAAVAERDEARKLVAALLEAGEFSEWHERDHLEGSFEVCYGCRLATPPHGEDCVVDAARRAVAAWGGDGD